MNSNRDNWTSHPWNTLLKSNLSNRSKSSHGIRSIFIWSMVICDHVPPRKFWHHSNACSVVTISCGTADRRSKCESLNDHPIASLWSLARESSYRLTGPAILWIDWRIFSLIDIVSRLQLLFLFIFDESQYICIPYITTRMTHTPPSIWWLIRSWRNSFSWGMMNGNGQGGKMVVLIREKEFIWKKEEENGTDRSKSSLRRGPISIGKCLE